MKRDNATESSIEEVKLLAVGLMSGTSIDGIDAAIVETDGVRSVRPISFHSEFYEPEFANSLRAILGRKDRSSEIDEVERELTLLHAKAVSRLLAKSDVRAEAVDVIGFHGHTIHHEPDQRFTWQIGDGALLAEEIGIDVVADFRSADVANGGEGAPLAPVFHAALLGDRDLPIAILNIGGVANVTFIGNYDELIAFDTGPGNALIDDWANRNIGKPMDRDGALAKRGKVDREVLAELLDNSYFERLPPKSLDRNNFDSSPVEPMLVEDGAATLTQFSVESIAISRRHFPEQPKRWIVCGGGRRNPALMAGLRNALGVAVEPIESAGWDGDAIEAQAFAYLACRTLKGMPIRFPETTGVLEPQIGGVLFRAA